MLSKNWKISVKQYNVIIHKKHSFEEKKQFFTDNLERDNFLGKKLINYL